MIGQPPLTYEKLKWKWLIAVAILSQSTVSFGFCAMRSKTKIFNLLQVAEHGSQQTGPDHHSHDHPFSAGKNDGLNIQSFTSFSYADGVGDIYKNVFNKE